MIENAKFAEILGIYYGDGSISKRNMRINLSSIDKEFINHFKKLLSYFTTKKISIYQLANDNVNHNIVYKVVVNDKKLAKIIMRYNKKHIPNWVCDNEKFFYSFIRGFADSEGRVGKRNSHNYGFMIRITQKDKQVLRKIHKCLLLYGINSKVRFRKTIYGGVYDLNIKTKKDVILFRDRIGFAIKRKQEKLVSLKSEKSLNTI